MGRLGLGPRSNETALYHSTCGLDVVEYLQIVLISSEWSSFCLFKDGRIVWDLHCKVA